MTVTVPTDRQTREFQIRAANEEQRTFTGIGVPYGQEIEHWFGRETFDAGSVQDAENARVLWQHREPIGVITSTRETSDGFEVTGKISRTPRGDEAMTLLKDGVIRSLSIGFEPQEYTVESRDAAQGGDLIHWTKVRAAEFSLVTFPAYDAAEISSVRHQNPAPKGNPMPETAAPEALTRADLQPFENSVEELRRDVALLGSTSAPSPASQWRSMGEFLKALARGDEAAAEFHREYTGATTGDTIMKDSFVGDFIKLVAERRRIMDQFTKGTLPGDGMSVDYYQLESDDTKVAEQLKEGDDLEYGEIKLKSANAPVKTYGGWTELTRQAIERATVPALNTTLRAMGLRYARVTNGATGKVYAKMIADNLAADPDQKLSVKVPAALTTDALLDSIVDAALLYEERGYTLAGLNASVDVFKQILHLKDGDRRVMKVYGDGVNQVGELSLPGVSGNLAGVKVSLLPNTAGSVASFYDPVAIETLESSGAPAQLQDDNIINLSKQFSIYGYAAVITPFTDAVLPLDFQA